jgi:hypothetical protein
MKFKIGDKVTYSGSEERYNGTTGTIIHTKEQRSLEDDISRGGAVVYPKDGFDYTIKFNRYGFIKSVLDVMEDEIK